MYKMLGVRQQKSQSTKKEEMKKGFAANWVNWQQVSNMTVQEK